MNELEKALGRPVDSRPRKSIATLNDVTAEMVDELRRLSDRRTLAHRYLDHYVVRSAGELDDFLDAVIDRGQDPSSWGFSDQLVTPREDCKLDPFVLGWAAAEGVLAAVYLTGTTGAAGLVGAGTAAEVE